MMIRRQIYLTPAEVKQLAALSKRYGLTISDIVRRAIDSYVASKAAKRISDEDE